MPQSRRRLGDGVSKEPGRITYEHPVGFWTGIVTVIFGIFTQLPMYYDSRMNHYHLVGMKIPIEMYVGMILIVVGTLLATWGLFPLRAGMDPQISKIRIDALDATPIKRSHVALILVLAIAITIDIMKPTTLAFVASGAAAEYGLRGPLNPHAHGLPVALYPLSGISGTVLGSFIWGSLSDRIGRRASILIAGVIFISTSTCGAMPAFWLNLVCCVFMGIGAGGMLPVAFTLMSETIPARHRGWLMVLVGGSAAGSAYVIVSWLASTIGAPDRFGWRILWLIGMPTGLALILLNRWIPESPRFLLQRGRSEMARSVMARYGAAVIEEDSELEVESQISDRFVQLFTSPFVALGICVALLGVSIGLTQYGFQQWIPTNLQKFGYSSVNATRILRDSALLGLPLTLPVAYLYGFWSSRKTITLIALTNVIAMAGFITGGSGVVHRRGVLEALLIVPTWSVGILASVLAAYAVEIYPTKIRSRGGGLSAGATKVGGVLVLTIAAAAVAAPSIRMTAIVAVVPMALAIIAIIAFGPETHGRSLEEITVEETMRVATDHTIG